MDSKPHYHLYSDVIVTLSIKYLTLASISSHLDLDIFDISGFSNITYIVNHKSDQNNKIVIRFFKSKVSDFETEA